VVVSASDEAIMELAGVDPLTELPAVINVAHGIAVQYHGDLASADIEPLLVGYLNILSLHSLFGSLKSKNKLSSFLVDIKFIFSANDTFWYCWLHMISHFFF